MNAGVVFLGMGLCYMVVAYNLKLFGASLYNIENFDKIYSIAVLCFCCSTMHAYNKYLIPWIAFAGAFNACLDECFLNASNSSLAEYIQGFTFLASLTLFFYRGKLIDFGRRF